jgi:pimeloyl-ACP methyl ester carboxylesterase
MRHLVIFLPGIMGSALQKDGKDLWALSGQALWQFLKARGQSIAQLQVQQDDPEANDLGDGVTAPRLLEDVHSVPFIVEHAGYGVITRRLPEHFEMTPGSIHAPADEANFYAFPYDWRRDNRATARKLQRFIEQQLPRWREYSGASDAQVILIAHSMGGLVSRYYVEALGGWRNCRVLITVGSPHRGALGALATVSNGFSKGAAKLFNFLNPVVRSFESLHQCFPAYQAVHVNGQWVRPAEADLPNVDRARAQAARAAFLDATRQAAIQNRADPQYRQVLLPWVGTRQATHQSLILENGALRLDHGLPAGLDPKSYPADGDGTVARLSAIPAELDGQQIARFAVERHGWLTNNEMTLDPLLDTLTQLVAAGTQNLYGEPESARPALNLGLEPLYLPDEPALLSLRLENAGEQTQSLSVKVEPVGHAGPGATQSVQVGAEAKGLEFGALQAGLYQVTVSAQTPGPRAPAPVHGVFEVADASALD